MEFRVKAAKGLEFMGDPAECCSTFPAFVIFADSQDSANYKLSNHVSKRAILVLLLTCRRWFQAKRHETLQSLHPAFRPLFLTVATE